MTQSYDEYMNDIHDKAAFEVAIGEAEMASSVPFDVVTRFASAACIATYLRAAGIVESSDVTTVDLAEHQKSQIRKLRDVTAPKSG